jgi:hypothetical protein
VISPEAGSMDSARLVIRLAGAVVGRCFFFFKLIPWTRLDCSYDFDMADIAGSALP